MLCFHIQIERTKHWQMTQDRQFEMDQIIRVDPILRRLSDKRTLASTCARVSLNWVTACADQIIELGQLNNESIPIILVERPLFQIILYKSRFERTICLFLCIRTILAGVSHKEELIMTLFTYIMFLERQRRVVV